MMKVKFTCRSDVEGSIPLPETASKCLPSYFRPIKPQSNDSPNSNTVKRCVPFIDAMSQGFILPLWTDVYVRSEDGELSVDLPENNRLYEGIGEHSLEQIPDHPLVENPYGKIILKFENPWTIETEKGVSCIFTSPLNHLETRFKILDGVVDTDTYYNPVNFPFIWTGGDGQFMIPRGTPLVQIIPFRREGAKLEVGITDENRNLKVQTTLGTVFRNAYRTFFWHKRKD